MVYIRVIWILTRLQSVSHVARKATKHGCHHHMDIVHFVRNSDRQCSLQLNEQTRRTVVSSTAAHCGFVPRQKQQKISRVISEGQVTI